jgi:hypothetical protein
MKNEIRFSNIYFINFGNKFQKNATDIFSNQINLSYYPIEIGFQLINRIHLKKYYWAFSKNEKKYLLTA